MSSTTEIIILLASTFLLGLLRGSAVCATVCAPGLIPITISEKLTRKEALTLGIIFNLPRITILTILGAVVGFISFNLVEESSFKTGFSVVGISGYFLVGIFLLIFGGVTFAKGEDERLDIKEGKIDFEKACKSCPASIEKKKRFFFA